MTEPSAAEWAVVTSMYPHFAAVGPISKETARRIYHPAPYNAARTAFTDLSKVLYRGPEGACSRLTEQMQSSEALMAEERRASSERHEKRISDAIAKAFEPVASREAESSPPGKLREHP